MNGEHSGESGPEAGESLLRRLETLEESVPLTEQQHAELEGLKSDIARLCEAGQTEEAKRCFALAAAMVEQGPPAPE